MDDDDDDDEISKLLYLKKSSASAVSTNSVKSCYCFSHGLTRWKRGLRSLDTGLDMCSHVQRGPINSSKAHSAISNITNDWQIDSYLTSLTWATGPLPWINLRSVKSKNSASVHVLSAQYNQQSSRLHHAGHRVGVTAPLAVCGLGGWGIPGDFWTYSWAATLPGRRTTCKWLYQFPILDVEAVCI